MLAANLAAFIALKRGNVHLNRDVIFLATADEEQFGDASMKMLIAKYWDKFAAGYAINEGGKVFVKNGKVQYVAVQASEKVSVNVAVTVTRKVGARVACRPKTMRWCIWPRRRENRQLFRAGASHVHCAPIFRALARARRRRNWPSGCACLILPDRGEHAQKVVSEANPHVEFHDARHHCADDAAGRSARQRDSRGGPRHSEHPPCCRATPSTCWSAI